MKATNKNLPLVTRKDILPECVYHRTLRGSISETFCSVISRHDGSFFPIYVSFFFFFFSGLRTEHEALCFLGKCSNTVLNPPLMIFLSLMVLCVYNHQPVIPLLSGYCDSASHLHMPSLILHNLWTRFLSQKVLKSLKSWQLGKTHISCVYSQPTSSTHLYFIATMSCT